MYRAEARHPFFPDSPWHRTAATLTTPTHTPTSTWLPHKGAAPSIPQRRDPAHMHLTLQQRAESQASLCVGKPRPSISVCLPTLVSRPSSVPVKG